MKYLAYDQTMYVFASTCVFGFLMANFLIPSELNQTASDEELAELEMLEANAADADCANDSLFGLGLSIFMDGIRIPQNTE